MKEKKKQTKVGMGPEKKRPKKDWKAVEKGQMN